MKGQHMLNCQASAHKQADLQCVSGGSIHRDIQLRDGDQVANSVRELGIGDQEGGDMALVQLCQDGIDLWVHDWLANQR